MELIQSKTLLDKNYLSSLSNRANSSYSRFSIKKRDGGERVIYHPSKELKTIQRVLSDFLISCLDVHSASSAYRKGCSTKKNAQIHSMNKYFLRMDFKSFFESITSKDVKVFCDKYISKKFSGWNSEDTEFFTKFVSYKDRLVMGAVSSPSLTNAMCFKLDQILYELSDSHKVTYSRYADDLYFSSDTPNVLRIIESEVLRIVSELDLPEKLKINKSKTFHSSMKRKVVITGLVVTNSGVISIGRDKKREIRSSVFNWVRLDESKKSYLSGYLSYVKSIEPEFINSLCLKYGATVIEEVINFNVSKST